MSSPALGPLQRAESKSCLLNFLLALDAERSVLADSRLRNSSNAQASDFNCTSRMKFPHNQPTWLASARDLLRTEQPNTQHEMRELRIRGLSEELVVHTYAVYQTTAKISDISCNASIMSLDITPGHWTRRSGLRFRSRPLNCAISQFRRR